MLGLWFSALDQANATMRIADSDHLPRNGKIHVEERATAVQHHLPSLTLLFLKQVPLGQSDNHAFIALPRNSLNDVCAIARNRPREMQSVFPVNFSETGANQVRHALRVSLIGLDRHLGHLAPINALPVNAVAGISCKLTDELRNTSAIAFPEGMKHIQLAQVMASTLTERIRRKALQETFARKWSRDLWRIARDLLVAGEACCALRNVDRADLARPVIEVAEQPLMDLLKVRQVKRPRMGSVASS